MKSKYYNTAVQLSTIGLICITILTVSASAGFNTEITHETGNRSAYQSTETGNDCGETGIVPQDDASKWLDIEE